MKIVVIGRHELNGKMLIPRLGEDLGRVDPVHRSRRPSASAAHSRMVWHSPSRSEASRMKTWPCTGSTP
jgi:hypothetical protein